MCTVGYHKDLSLIFKNRDKSSPTPEEIVNDGDVLAGRTQGENYYSWGLNRHGCAFVSTAVNTPAWMELVYKGLQKEAQIQYKKENEGLTSPMILVSRMLPEVQKAEEWINELKSASVLSLGYNILVADKNGAFLVESYKSERHIKKLMPREVVTNHFQVLTHGPQKEPDYPSTFRRYKYGNETIVTCKSITDIFDMLKPASEEQKKKIWRNGAFSTVSSTVIDFKQRQIFNTRSENESYLSFSLTE